MKNPNVPSKLSSKNEFDTAKWTPSAKFVVDSINGCFPGMFSMSTYWDGGGDHGKGNAIDIFPGKFGQKATGQDKVDGDTLANWAKTNAASLKIQYIIWYGKIWNIDVASDPPGTFEDCCKRNRCKCTNDTTQGHFDHVHISVK
jgi:hypothetical protein